MNVITQNPIDDHVIDGTWLETTVVSDPASGENYNSDNGIFSDETAAISSREYAFIPAERFLGRTVTITDESDAGGVLLRRVASNGASRIHKLDSSTAGGVVKSKFHGFVADSYGEAVAAILKPMMDAEGATWDLFNAGATQWNRNCWGDAFDLSGIVTRSSYSGGWTKERGGLLMTPRHIRIANHFQIGVGQQVQLIIKGATAAQDQVVTKTLTHGIRYPNQTTDFDSYIYLLDSDVPTGIEPFRCISTPSRAPSVMCGKYSDLVLATASNKNQLGGGVDNQLSVFVNSSGGVYGSTYTRTGLPEYVAEWMPFWDGYADFIRPVVSGDSGSQILYVYDAEELVFVTTSEGASENEAIAAVDALAGISTGYTVTVAPDPTL